MVVNILIRCIQLLIHTFRLNHIDKFKLKDYNGCTYSIGIKFNQLNKFTLDILEGHIL